MDWHIETTVLIILTSLPTSIIGSLSKSLNLSELLLYL